MRISGLHRVGLQVPDFERARDFYHRNWGLGLIGTEGQQASFRAAHSHQCDLQLCAGDEARLDHIALSVATEDMMRSLLENLERQGHPVTEAPRPGRRQGEALVACFDDLDGNRVELVVPSESDGPAAEATRDGEAEGPLKLGHVVLWSPRQTEQEAFYALLGFKVSDRTHIGMSFLRCNTDHHSLAFVNSNSGRTGLQHLAFDVGSIDTVMRESARMRDEGNPCIWGVGRHGPGNNVFSYYQDPAGNVVEYYGEMDVFEDTSPVEERFWGPEHKGDVWGISGPPPAPFHD